MALLKWLQGKKTYIIAIIVGILAALNQLGIQVPSWVMPLLGALGLATLRAAITKTEPK